MTIKSMWIKFLILFAVLQAGHLYGQGDLALRKQYLADLKHIMIDQRFQANTRRATHQDSTWVAWLNRTGELPPDFSKMKSTPFLPNLLTYEKDGKEHPIRTEDEWKVKREWIKEQYQYWISGNFPEAPNNLTSEILLDSVSDGVRIQKVRLDFGPEKAAKLHLELWLPIVNGGLPVFMTQYTHKDWGRLALRRGYAVCLYAGGDTWDDTQAYQAIYPEHDFSMLMRRAWGASRVIDYLYTRSEINKNQIAINGHSRNGKQALWATAFDDRISAVVSSSSSTGGDAPWRFGDPQYASETLDLVTAANVHWFHPRLRFFFGNEDKLPVDQHALAALIAPRPLLFHYSFTERGLNVWANEQNYYETKKVYDFLGAGERIGVLARRGEHAVAARDVELTLDFLDKHFQRRDVIWDNRLFYAYDFDDWCSSNDELRIEAQTMKAVELKSSYENTDAFAQDRTIITQNIEWLMGERPGRVLPDEVGESVPGRYDWIESIIGRPQPKNGIVKYFGPYNSFGDHLPVRVYYPKNKNGKIEEKKHPVVIYLHQYAHSTGYSKGYNKLHGNTSNHILFGELLAKGYAVVAFDQFGFGTRAEEAIRFYERIPEWSKMGKMVDDVKSVIDGLAKVPHLDQENIFILGDALGGTVGLYATVLDDRVKGLASLSGFYPYRSSDTQYESIKNISHLHGLMPRLGLFADTPQKVPVDMAEIVACIAPRPVMVIAPTLDRYGDNNAILQSVDKAKNVYALYGKEEAVQLYRPKDINRMSPETLANIIKFFEQHK